MDSLRQNDNKKAILIFSIIFFVLGIFVGFNYPPEVSEAQNNQAQNFTVKEVANQRPDLNLFWKVWDTINKKYPNADEVTSEDRVYGAISGLVDSLDDPYTVFLTKEEAKSFEEDIAGNFSGIGIEVDIKDKILTVIAPLKGTPAERAGIKPGDRILKIDKAAATGLSIDSAIKLIRGEKGTPVILTILREGERSTREIKVVRDTINVPVLDTELRKDGIFVIKLYSFTLNSPSLFRGAMGKFKDSKSNKLILDLRGNPGGYLSPAVDIASWFLPNGKTVVIEDYGANKKQYIFRSKGYNQVSENVRLVILINQGSASASEILAGAMQDHKRALLVGEQSFGKGSVQELIRVTPEALLKITTSKWLTPNGNWISEKGLTPDYKVERTEADVAAKRDPQMDKAVQLLLR